MPDQNFIDNEWRPARGGATDDIVNPATGAVIGTAPASEAADVDDAVAAAARAFPEWAAKTPRERSEAIHELARRIEADIDNLSAIEAENVGKPVSIMEFEMDLTLDNWKFFASAGRFLEGRAAGEYMAGYTSMLRREPLGVIGSIAPWNYPLNMATWKVAPALVVGNTVVLKPSELTPYTALRLAELAADVLPPGVLNVVCGQGETAGVALVAHPDVAMVSLTGSVAAGKAIAKASSDTLKRVHLELGGKAPVVVFDDADAAAVAAGVRAAGYYNSGQDCTAACRVIAGPKVHDELVAALQAEVSQIPFGDPTDADTEVGPVVSAEQLDRVSGMVSRAKDAGAEVLTSATLPGGGGYFYAPSIVVGPAQDSEIVQREVFGPVVTVQRAAERGDAPRMGQRRRLRPRRLRVDHRRRTGDAHGCRSALRHRVGERPHPDHERDAPRRLQAERLRQGHVHLRRRALHRAQARDDQALGRRRYLASTTSMVPCMP